MAQIVQRAPTALDTFSQGLGTGLNQLAQHKLGQISQQKNLQDLLSSGISSQDAQLINMFHGQPEIQAKLLGELFQRGPSQQGSAPGQSLGQQAQEEQPQQQFGLNELAQILTQQPGAQQALQGLMGQSQSQSQQPQQQPQRPPIAQAQESGSSFYREPLKQREAREFKNKQLDAREEAALRKEKLPYINTTRQEAKASRTGLQRLKKMDKLIDKQELSNPLFASALKTIKNGVWGFGVDLTGLLNADSQEFEKLTNDFVRDAQKATGGGRLTNEILKTFISSVPNLSQTDSGKKRVINNLSMLSEMAIAREEALDKIIKENKGKIPYNIEQLVEDKAGPKLDKLADQFDQKNKDLEEYDTFANRIKRDREYWLGLLKK